MLTQLRNIFIVVCALNFLALMGLAGALYTGGAINRNTLFEAVYLFRGTHRAVPQEAVDDYERMRKENEQYATLFREEKGTGEIFTRARDTGQKEMLAAREETERVLLQRLEAYKKALDDERGTIETLMKKEQELRDEIVRLKTDAAQKAAARNTEVFNSVLQGMDAEDVARVLAGMVAEKDRTAADRAVQWLRSWNQKYASDVLTEMDAGAREVLVRMLEDEYADIPPENIALRWKAESMPTNEMVIHLRTMPLAKAMKVMRKLDRNVQDDLWEQFAPLQPGGGG